jgi:uncharacterized protein YqeY
MSLQKEIRENMVKAMKSKNKELVIFLKVVMGEFGRIDKEVTDEQAISVIRKMKTTAEDLGNQFEVDVLEPYLPKMLSEVAIVIAVEKIIKDNGFSGMREMGKVMKVLMPRVQGRADGSNVSASVRTLLTTE